MLRLLKYLFPNLIPWHASKLTKLSVCIAKSMTTIIKIYILHFTLKTHQMFSIHATPQKSVVIIQFSICVRGKLGQDSHDCRKVIKTQSGFFKFFRFKEVFS